MKNKTTYWALGILGVYTIIFLAIFLGSNDMYAAIGYAIFMAYAIGLEVIILFVLGLVWHLRSRKDGIENTRELKTKGKHFLLASLMVLLVGFSVCVGGSMIVGG